MKHQVCQQVKVVGNLNRVTSTLQKWGNYFWPGFHQAFAPVVDVQKALHTH